MILPARRKRSVTCGSPGSRIRPAPMRPTRLRDGKAYRGTTVVARGSSAPNLLGKFNDKTAIEADRTGGACDGNVYFSWSRFTGNGGVGIYFSRSTDHGVTFSSPMKLTSMGPRRPVPGHLRHGQRPRLRDLPPVRRERQESERRR